MQAVCFSWPQTPPTPGKSQPKPFGMDPRPGVAKTKKGDSSPQLAPPSAAIGTVAGAVRPVCTSNATSALGVETKIMELRGVLELRKSQALTPYRIEAWISFLHHCKL